MIIFLDQYFSLFLCIHVHTLNSGGVIKMCRVYESKIQHISERVCFIT